MEPFFAEVDKLEGVKVDSPYSPEGASFNSTTEPIAFAELGVTERSQAETLTLADDIKDLGDAVRRPPVCRSSTAVSSSKRSSFPRARCSACSRP